MRCSSDPSEMPKKASYGFKIYPGNKNSKGDDKAAAGNRYVCYMNAPDTRVISFKGGGSRVFVYIKFLEVAHRMGVLDTVKEVGGSSSGSIAAAFAALHYEDPLKRSEALDAITNSDRKDIFAESTGQKKRQGFKRFVGGLYNLVTKGGVYRGDKVEECLRERIHADTHAGLHAILDKLRKDGHEEKRAAIIRRIIEIGLGSVKMVGDKRTLVLDAEKISFINLAELSKLTDGKFKEYYCTAVNKRTKELLVFNKDNTPDVPIYFGVRLAITFPLYYQAKTYNGDKYIDGGSINNSPVDLATSMPVERSKQEQEIADTLGLSDNQARLNVRVEYLEKDYLNKVTYPDPENKKYLEQLQFNLYSKQLTKSRGRRFKDSILSFLAKLLTGVDVYAHDKVSTDKIQNDFPQRTLQLYDFKVSQMEDNLSPEKRAECDVEVAEETEFHFNQHAGETAWVTYQEGDDNHVPLQDAPPHMQLALLQYLQNPDVKTEDIFIFPEKSAEELQLMREHEVKRLQELTSRIPYQESTSRIARAFAMEVVMPNNNNIILPPVSAVLESLVVNDGHVHEAVREKIPPMMSAYNNL